MTVSSPPKHIIQTDHKTAQTKQKRERVCTDKHAGTVNTVLPTYICIIT